MVNLLRINLSAKSYSVEALEEKIEEQYFGGAGVAAALLTKEVSPDVSGLDPQNKLLLSVGPFCGTTVPFNGRHFFTSKSPLTGIIGESSAGGSFGKEFAWTGYNILIIEGKSDTPVFIYISDEKVEILDATDVWGKGVNETDDLLKAKIGDDKSKVACIGIAGENLVKIAGIMSEKDRAAARCGLGAVMGSKNLKAIVVRGKKSPVVADKEKLQEATKAIHEIIKGSAMAMVYREYGTPTSMDSMAGVGDIPIKNYSLPKWSDTKKIGSEALYARGEVKKHACFACPVACTGVIQYEDKWVRWPEYETLAMVGSNLLVGDLETIIKFNVLINDLGMDTISLGGILGLFLEAMELGKLEINLDEIGFSKDPENENAYTLWGDTKGIENLIQMIAEKKGIGADLSEGVRAMIKKYDLPEVLNLQVKGLEVPAHEPRANNMTALDYATTPRGAYHCYMPMHLSQAMNLKKDIGLDKAIDRFKGEGMVNAVIKVQDASEAFVSCGGCIFGFNFVSEIQPWIDCLNAITGKSYDTDSWMKVGSDLMNLKRQYMEKYGITKADDALNSRFLTAFPKGGTRKNVPPLEAMLKEYYEIRNW